jgi:hypothetical protein
MNNSVDLLTIINTAVGITSLVVSFVFGGFAIWLSLYFYTKCLNLNRNSCIMLSNIAGHKVRLIF